MIEKTMVKPLAELIYQHLWADGGDGDVCILFGKEAAGMIDLLKEEVISKDGYWSEYPSSSEGTVVLSDGSNENIILTTNEEVYDNQPSWVGLLIKYRI